MKKIFLGLLIFLFSITHTAHYKLTSRINFIGFFSEFHTVLGALDYYERHGNIEGLEVDFQTGGLFFDPKRRPNYWQYYFEPINIKKTTLSIDEDQKRFERYKKIIFSFHGQYGLSRERSHELIKKYIKPKAHIQQKIDQFCDAHFKDKHVIGIHYRGTDKCRAEAERVDYTDICNAIENELSNHPDAIIFIATDEQQFLEYARKRFPEKVVSIDMDRSVDGKPLHKMRTSPYETGESAVIDCLLLSRCSTLFKTASNLSDAAGKFNPMLPSTILNTDWFGKVAEQNKYQPLEGLQLALSMIDQHERTGKDFSMHLPIAGNRYYQMADGSAPDNWWTLHFKPLSVGENPELTMLPSYEISIRCLESFFEMPKKRANTLLAKYIHFKQETEDKIDAFVEQEFKDRFVLGVFYRKRHSILTQVPIAAESYISYLTLRKKQIPESKLFVSTDDAQFLRIMKENFNNVISYSHPGDTTLSAQQKEEEALIDCSLLAKTNEIVGNGSAMLETVKQFNPELPIKEFDTLWLKQSS